MLATESSPVVLPRKIVNLTPWIGTVLVGTPIAFGLLAGWDQALVVIVGETFGTLSAVSGWLLIKHVISMLEPQTKDSATKTPALDPLLISDGTIIEGTCRYV